MESRTGTVVYSKNADHFIPTDTILPLLISMAVLDERDPDEYLLISSDVQQMSTQITNGTAEIGLKPGERLSIRQLLSSVLLANSQDACQALAGAFEDESALLARIQSKVTELDLDSTVITSYLTGPDLEDHTTVADTAKVMRAFLRYPVLAGLNRMPSYSFTPTNMVPESREIKNTHLQLTQGAAGSPQVLPGFLAGISSLIPWQTSFVAAAEKNSGVFIVALDGPARADASWSANKLFEWAASEVETVKLISRGEAISHLDLADGKQLELTSDSDVYYLAPAASPKPSFTLNFRPGPDAKGTIEKDQPLGSAEVVVGEEAIALVSLLAERSVSAAELHPVAAAAPASGPNWIIRILIGLLVSALLVFTIRTFNLLRRSKRRQAELRRTRQAILEKKREDARRMAYGSRRDIPET